MAEPISTGAALATIAGISLGGGILSGIFGGRQKDKDRKLSKWQFLQQLALEKDALRQRDQHFQQNYLLDKSRDRRDEGSHALNTLSGLHNLRINKQRAEPLDFISALL